MFFIYGAHNSRACEKAEFALFTLGYEYRFYCYGIDYTLAQIQRLVPGAKTVPQIFHGTKYIGGLNELYEFLQESEDSSARRIARTPSNKRVFDIFSENESNIGDDSSKQ
jgi:glutaredoxin